MGAGDVVLSTAADDGFGAALTSSPADTTSKDTNCLYCNDLFHQSSESWVACPDYHRWAHSSYAGKEDKNKNPVLYQLCQD